MILVGTEGQQNVSFPGIIRPRCNHKTLFEMYYRFHSMWIDSGLDRASLVYE